MLDTFWGRKTITYVKDLVNLSEEQIYKWGYERKRKEKMNQEPEIHKNIDSDDRTEKSSYSNIKDYNSMVDELFPMSEFSSDELSTEERALYDKVKKEITSKDKVYKGMNDLDRLLWERIALSDIIRNSKQHSNLAEVVKSETKTVQAEEDIWVESKEETDTNEISFESDPSPYKNKRSMKAAHKLNDFEQFEWELKNMNLDLKDELFFASLTNNEFVVEDDCISFF